MRCETMMDAKTIVDNSGVVDWDWGDHDPEEVLSNLAAYIYNECDTGEVIGDKRFDELLAGFIADILDEDPENYSLKPVREIASFHMIKGFEVLQKTVAARGTSGGVYVPPSWVGKRVKIVRLDP